MAVTYSASLKTNRLNLVANALGTATAPPVEVRQPVFVSLRRAASRQAHSG